MDFVVVFPLTSHIHDAIMVVNDKLTKTPHFILDKGTYDVVYVMQVFISEIVFLHEFPKNIFSDRDDRFTSKLGKVYNHP